MTATTLTERARAAERPPPGNGFERILGHPLAFLGTSLILLALFGATFVTNPDRVAPTKDPAYYTWRTEALMTEDPATVLEITGPFDFFSSGYRITAPVTGAMLRHIPAVSELHMTAWLMVLTPVLTALLLAGFAYRQRRDPLVWHSVAFLSASLFLTPPFVGYVDNVLCLMFLAASLSFITAARSSWPARAGFGLFALAAGLTHPTTLVFFGLTLGLMSIVKLVWRKFDVRSVLREDGPLLGTALVSALITYAVWTIGVWGPSAPLTDAALAPPYDSAFFVDRLIVWIKAMRPLFNGPLMALGVVGLLVAFRRNRAKPGGTPADDDLTRVSVLWLIPLAGLFGFLGGLTYPYYRFFNTTLAWVLLVGLGGAFLVGLLWERSKVVGAIALGVVALVVATNFSTGFELSGWNDAQRGWVSASAREDLGSLRTSLEGLRDEDRPVVFVIDQENHGPQVYGYTKLSGNTSRFGLPDGMIDQGYMYVGSLDNFLEGSATGDDGAPSSDYSCSETKDALGDDVYTVLSTATLCDIQENTGTEPLVVVARAFNATGANASMFEGDPSVSGGDVWLVDGGEVIAASGAEPAPARPDSEDPSPLHLVQVVVGFLLLLLPGILAFKWFLPDGQWDAEGLGMVPALSIALISIVGLVVLAVAGAPLGTTLAYTILAAAIVVAGAAFLAARRSGAATH